MNQDYCFDKVITALFRIIFAFEPDYPDYEICFPMNE